MLRIQVLRLGSLHLAAIQVRQLYLVTAPHILRIASFHQQDPGGFESLYYRFSSRYWVPSIHFWFFGR